MTKMLALLKRELLEHKNIWRVPLILIGIAVLVKLSMGFGNLKLDVNVPTHFDIDKTVDSLVNSATVKALKGVNYMVMLVMFIVAIFYSLSSLFDERQDQSVLFWRSLPISDVETILSKLIVGLAIIPVVILVAQSIVALIFLGGDGFAYLSNYIANSVGSLSKIVLWSMLPVIAWCLLCSQIASKNPFLFAIVIPVVAILIDKLFLDGMVSDTFVINRLTGVDHYTPTLLISGLVFSAACLAMTVARRGQLA